MVGVLVEVTDTKNQKSGVDEDKERQGEDMDYSSIKMLLLIIHFSVSARLAEQNELSYTTSCFPQLKWRHHK